MPYIGNTIRAADDYRLIDDISSGFNGNNTTFALQVAGSAPVPFPKSPQQVLISVNGVIQEPDPTGSSGFNLVGTNIVFSSAPTNGHAFFGIIYATADYLNAGGNFPAGSLGAPSLTFIGDEDTGIYRKGSGSIGFVSNSTEIANTDSNGITISSGNLILGDSSGTSDDRIAVGAGGDLHIYHDGTNSYVSNATGDLNLFSVGGNADDVTIRAQDDIFLQPNNGAAGLTITGGGGIILYHNAAQKFETTSTGATVTGNLAFGDNGKASFGASGDLQIFHNGSNSLINDLGTGGVIIAASKTNIMNAAAGENMAVFNDNGSVELYHDNTKRFETTANGVEVSAGRLDVGSVTLSGGGLALADNDKVNCGSGDDLQIYHDGTFNYIAAVNAHEVHINANSGGSTENMAKFKPNGAVELYHNHVKKFETSSVGVNVSGNLSVNDGAMTITHSVPQISFEDNSGSNGNDFAIQVNGNQFKIIDTDNSSRMGFQFGSDGNTALGGNTTFNGDIRASADSTHDVGTNSVRFANGYFDTLYGDGSNLTGISSGAISSIANDGANRLLTSDGDGTATAHQDFNVANQRLTCRHTAASTTYPLFLQNRTNGDSRVGIQMIATGSDISDGQFATIEARGQLAGNTSHALFFKTCTSGGTPTDRLNIDINGHTLPGADNTYNLGSASVRWANVFTADLQLSNKGSSNDIDGTWGSYTIQEGAEDLFLINKRTGKKFRFNLTEVS